MNTGKLIEQCLNIVYPRRCPLCGEIVSKEDGKACSNCYKQLKKISEPKCKCCGKSIETMEKEYCFDCDRKEFYFEMGFSLWDYSTKMKKSIAMFKYHNRQEYADFYGEEFVKEFGERIIELEPDVLVPVPIHWTRYIQRGYNQAELIAKKIGDALNIPVVDDILVRTKKTTAQKNLDNKERSRNMEGAFAIGKQWKNQCSALKKVVIIDDIYTTGSTINTCAKLLREKGVAEVYFGVLCIGKGY